MNSISRHPALSRTLEYDAHTLAHQLVDYLSAVRVLTLGDASGQQQTPLTLREIHAIVRPADDLARALIEVLDAQNNAGGAK